MSAMWVIARREFLRYFQGWSGYILLAAYLLITGLLFNAYALGQRPKLSQQVLEDYLYMASGMAMVTGLLLALRLFAEERQGHTLVLLRTAPVSERSVVWGKYLSAVAFLAVTLVLSLYLPALIFVNGKVSLSHIAVGTLGLLLVGAAAAAIGLLASVWSRTQLMAGVLGGAMLTLLLIAWMLARISEPPLKAVLEQVALHNEHFRTFRAGILHVRDLVYYLGVIALFVEGAVQSLESWRWRE
jgi:ABC-2 type transport system permease protein